MSGRVAVPDTPPHAASLRTRGGGAARSEASRLTHGLRIGIDLGLCTPAYGGIGRYVEELTRACVAGEGGQDQDRFVLFTGSHAPRWLTHPGVEQAHAEERMRYGVEPARGPTHPALRANAVVGPRLRQYGLDVFHAPDTLAFPFTAPRRLRLVATVHDLIPLLFPRVVTRRHRWLRLAALYGVVRRADVLLADSRATADDLMTRYPQARGKTRVVHLGVDPRFAPASSEAVARVRHTLGLPAQYLLYAGVINPVKNLERLIDAYAILAHERRETPPLIIAGRRGWLVDGIVRRVSERRLMGRVRFCGFVPEPALPALLTGATAFLFPSLYEGFGLPILEAMACGAAVVTSDRGSMPEVAGDAAELVNPERPEAIADGIRAVLEDTGRRQDLGRRGRARAGQFRWRDTARRTREAYREAVT